MSMPQVHITVIAANGDSDGAGAEMLSLMLGVGIVSRLATGVIADRVGGLPTLLMGSTLQGVALLLYLFFDGLASLYVISALFGLFQGGIVPSYAIIVREYFPPREAGTRIGFVIMATLFGMALGGWMSGDLRLCGNIPRRLRQWPRLEPAQRHDRDAVAHSSGRKTCSFDRPAEFSAADAATQPFAELP
jgi:MFS family permease